MPTTDRRPLFLAALTMATWGAAGSFVRLLSVPLLPAAPFTAFAVLGGRLALSFALLALFLLLFGREAWQQTIAPALRQRHTWIAGAFQFAYYALAVMAFAFAPISEIALCASTAPLWVLLINKMRGQVVTQMEAVGAFVALGGVAVIVAPHLFLPHDAAITDPFPHRIWGNALSLSSACVTALYALYQRRCTDADRGLEPRALSLVTFALGVPFVVFLRPVAPSVLFSPSVAALFGGLAAFTTVLPTLSFAWASRRLPPVTTATLALLLPVFAASYAALVLHEMPSWTLLPGGLLVLCGLLLILRPAKR